MIRLKIGLVLIGLVATMAISSSPALALFESETGKLSGTVPPSEIKSGGEFVYEASSPKTAVKCPPSLVGIQWKLSSKSSPFQRVQIKWGKESCKLEIGSSQLKADVSESEILVSSPESGSPKYTQLKGSNLNETQIKIEKGLCEIKVPVAGNQERKKTEQTSPSLTSFEEEIKVNSTEIVSEQTFVKPKLGCGLPKNSTTGELKGVELNLKGQGQR